MRWHPAISPPDLCNVCSFMQVLSPSASPSHLVDIDPFMNQHRTLGVISYTVPVSCSMRDIIPACDLTIQPVAKTVPTLSAKVSSYMKPSLTLFLPSASCSERPGRMTHFPRTLAAPCPLRFRLLSLWERGEVSGWLHLVSSKHNPMRLSLLPLNYSEP